MSNRLQTQIPKKAVHHTAGRLILTPSRCEITLPRRRSCLFTAHKIRQEESTLLASRK